MSHKPQMSFGRTSLFRAIAVDAKLPVPGRGAPQELLESSDTRHGGARYPQIEV